MFYFASISQLFPVEAVLAFGSTYCITLSGAEFTPLFVATLSHNHRTLSGNNVASRKPLNFWIPDSQTKWLNYLMQTLLTTNKFLTHNNQHSTVFKWRSTCVDPLYSLPHHVTIVHMPTLPLIWYIM